MDMSKRPIGVFDSGVGGLTVVKEIMRQIPNERIVFFGDTARVPYGSKSKSTITKYTRQIIRFLMTYDVKAIVIACGTASSCALEEVEKETDIPVIGVVKPGAKEAVERTHNKRIGVIATESSINSQMYGRFINQIDSDISVFGKACPLFVPLAEEGLWEDSVTYEIAVRYLKELTQRDIDTLILGCTHYPLLKKTIGKVVGDQVTLVNPAYETARELRELLQEQKLLQTEPVSDDSQYQFFVSDVADKFKSFAGTIFSGFDAALKTEQINIEEY